MRQTRCIYPYENDDRELLMTAPYERFCAKRITLVCDVLNPGCFQGEPVSRGQCIGFKENCPVYASIDGRIESIESKRLKYNYVGFFVHIELEKHGKILWSELPFYNHVEGSIFLQQLGIRYSDLNENTDILWIDGVESEPAGASLYRLIIEEPVKIILGANILARHFCAKKVFFCIEKEWLDIVYIIQKNLKKYCLLLDSEIDFVIKKYERQYPMPYDREHNRVFKVQMAIHAYNGVYEHQGILDTWVGIRGIIGRQGNFIIPIGTHMSDLLLFCGYEYKDGIKVIANGLLSGYSVSENEGLISIDMTGLCILLFSGYRENECIYCKRCAFVCPVKLKPYAMDLEMARKCMHCGCCSYVCPSQRRLTEKARRIAMLKQSDDFSGDCKKNRSRAKKKSKIKSMYVEIAPEFADILPALSLESDAGPYIHSPQRKKTYSRVLYICLMIILTYIMACILDFYHL